MADFETQHLPVDRTAIAPDGSDVRVLLGLACGGMAHFELGPNQVSNAVAHKTVEEIWYFAAGVKFTLTVTGYRKSHVQALK